MSNTKIVWLASYPRSGNTFLRTVLWHCFGLRSASVYSQDLGGNRELEDYVGHIEHRQMRFRVRFLAKSIPLLKTHEHPPDDNPAIYVIRDGRAACVSLWRFRDFTLEECIEGRHRFGTWSSHVQAWDPWSRPNTLLLKYEEMTNDLTQVLPKISTFLQREVLKTSIPDRSAIAEVDGLWVTKESNWRSDLSGDLLMRFIQINETYLRKAGYVPELDVRLKPRSA